MAMIICFVKIYITYWVGRLRLLIVGLNYPQNFTEPCICISGLERGAASVKKERGSCTNCIMGVLISKNYLEANMGGSLVFDLKFSNTFFSTRAHTPFHPFPLLA